MEQKKKIIIDTDCGSDDAMAIAMALNDPAYEIVMISTVSGNVHVDQATINTLTTIEYADTYEPPVYKGSDKMLLKELIYAHETHGNDGMGDIGLVPKRLKAQEGHGVLKMLEHLRNSEKGEIDIVALGPLTNIALALRLDYEAMQKAGRIIIMGTAGLGAGNVTPVAEFNIWQDAEAAKIVTESGLDQIIYVGWDACLGDSMLNPQEIDKIRNGSTLGKFAIDCNKDLMEMNKERFGDAYLDMADPSAMAAALYPECIDKCDKYYCEVDVTNGPSYGSMLVDVNYFSGKEPNVYICSKLHPDKYKEYIYRTLRVE
ncbi:nucleoside hydrolase [Mediterraneibacter sp. NSJ-55]|uniref:Nucleoside hydrolase n=1 Tax=Mediterraneibacter hominis TaxID=2763054 RepID=A0A923RQH4_9FIRM|nr:nucleoside hydrolase [Mediterraneibacter hominis]MBC5689535.1 nucleoside hydrolase [Mediterraneibacter hominis]